MRSFTVLECDRSVLPFFDSRSRVKSTSQQISASIVFSRTTPRPLTGNRTTCLVVGSVARVSHETASPRTSCPRGLKLGAMHACMEATRTCSPNTLMSSAALTTLAGRLCSGDTGFPCISLLVDYPCINMPASCCSCQLKAISILEHINRTLPVYHKYNVYHADHAVVACHALSCMCFRQGYI